MTTGNDMREAVEGEVFDPVEYGQPVVQADHESIASEADRLVNGDRQSDYGHPRDNFSAMADLFNDYIRMRGFTVSLDGADVAQLLLLMKVARFATGSRKRDTVVDQAGYAEVTARVIGLDP